MRAHGELDASRKWKRKTLRSRSQQLKPAALAKPTEEDESGGETNAIRVDQQPELMEIKEQRRGDGGRRGAVRSQEWENSAMTFDVSYETAATQFWPVNRRPVVPQLTTDSV